ncbi:trihelix transcription factor GT-3b-like [Canna indica]|uniref:Trihelix transcription factor GT-3b-like n=1 Tax=Canna indica TaxID=4628 RepID=A0AAQ3QPN8_9LILI|nr:trihelix transcription factor GT-3b-like [Canna indica]
MMFRGGGDGGGDGDPFGGQMVMLAGIPLQLSPSPASEMVGTSAALRQHQRVKDERVLQWGQQETRDLIATRADLERDLTVARRSKTLWEAAAGRMRERGYRRTPEQCKCKWKNLVNRYKGTETADPENGRQCPYFDELNAVFVERAKNMQRLLLESESGAPKSSKKLKRLSSSNEFSDEEVEDEDDVNATGGEERLPKSKRKKNNNRAAHQQAKAGGVQELLQELLKQQRRMEAQWEEMVERRAQERRAIEQEWRQAMEKLERERLLLERTWREREEQRRMREESRAEKREALLTTLLNKLIQDDL